MQHDRATQSQINGAKSSGPTTDEGRRKCANSSMKHGMYSSRVVLDNEDPAIYHALREAFLQIWNPTDAFEYECVIAMVNARWKFRRLEAAETAEMNFTMAEKRPEWDACDASTEHALALRTIGKHLDILARYQEQQHRTVQRNFNMLSKYRKKSNLPIPTCDEMARAESEAFQKTPESQEGPEPKPSASTKQPSILKKVALLFVILLLMPVQTTVHKKRAALASGPERSTIEPICLLV